MGGWVDGGGGVEVGAGVVDWLGVGIASVGLTSGEEVVGGEMLGARLA